MTTSPIWAALHLDYFLYQLDSLGARVVTRPPVWPVDEMLMSKPLTGYTFLSTVSTVLILLNMLN